MRDEVSDAEGHRAEPFITLGSLVDGQMFEEVFVSWNRFVRVLDPVHEDEKVNDAVILQAIELTVLSDQVPSMHARLSTYPASIHQAFPAESQLNKPLLARPTLTSGDGTLSSAAQPIIDEAVFAVRKWRAIVDRKSTRLNSSHSGESRMPSSA